MDLPFPVGMMAASYGSMAGLSTKRGVHLPDRFLCEDSSCWIDPAHVAEARRRRNPDLSVDPVVMYTPLAFGEGDADWLADALHPEAREALGDVNVRAPATSIRLPGGRLTTVVGSIGAPATVGALEGAIALGARQVLFFGICGSLQPDLKIGDIVVAESAIREEGTSFHYLPADVPARASRRLLDATDLPRGVIWTTDAPYRETRTKVSRLASEGVLGVEMEVSAVYALAQYRGIDALALLVISDQLVGEKWTGISRATFRERCDEAVQLLAEIGLRTAPAPA
jgi:uridine phosphorylase